MKYQLLKNIWTESDFDDMGWHDCLIYAISFGRNFEIFFDIDYIFKWELTGKKYAFWVSPCTLTFENVYNAKFEFDLTTDGLIMSEIGRENPQRPRNADHIKRDIEFDWIIETTQGSISFTSIGFRQFVRREPVLLKTQAIGLKERGGISFNIID